jgi:chemotaxis protein CheD
MADRSILVGMAEIHVIQSDAQFCCMGLGSCVAACALDPVLNIGGAIHVMLPQSPIEGHVEKLGKFADTGIPELISRMKGLGADLSRLKVALVGGASVVKFGGEASPATQIGERNVKAVEEEFAKLGVKPVVYDTGGNMGRTVQFDIQSGAIRVRTVNHGEREICSLRQAA